jgi:hypothetical protein
VLVSHDDHGDNLDSAGRALLPAAGVVLTTTAGSGRLGGNARGLAPWATTQLEAPGRAPIQVTATPCRHGPPLSRPIADDVIGFALAWPGQEHGVLWITGDTVLYGRRPPGRRPPPGRHRPAPPGMRALPGHRAGALQHDRPRGHPAVPAGPPRTVIPVHYEGWTHFRQDRPAIEGESAQAPADISRSIRWPPIGAGVEVAG